MGTTADWDLRYPDPTSDVQLWTHFQNLADDADDALSDVAAGQVPSVTTTTGSIGTVGTGFTFSDGRAATLCAGKLVDVTLTLVVTTALGSGNLSPDITCFTLATAYRPSTIREICADQGTVAAFGVINIDGTIVLRSTTGAIASGNLRISDTFIKN